MGTVNVIYNVAFGLFITLASFGHHNSGPVIIDRCPSYELLYPCYCNSIPSDNKDTDNTCHADTGILTYNCQIPVITCIGHKLDTLNEIFDKVSKNIFNIRYRKFQWFYLIDNGLTVLRHGVFEKLHFRNIYIKSCPNLRFINETAFGSGNGYYTRNVFINATSLSDEPLLRRATFKALSKLRNLDVLEIQTSNFTLIPFKAFNRNTNMRIIRFHNPDTKQKLQTIGSRAFYKANRLTEIDLKNNHISLVKPFAFQFQQESTHEVKVFLSANSLHSNSFAVNSLLGGNGRNITLYLGDYNNCNSQLTTLPQKVFEPFLLENVGNVIDMYGCPLLCDQRIEWLTFHLDRYQKQVRNLVCLTHDQDRFLSKDNYYHVLI